LRLAKTTPKEKGRKCATKTLKMHPILISIESQDKIIHTRTISKLQSLNYHYDSMNINIAMKTMIPNNRNRTAMVFKQICDAVITSYPINIFSMGTLYESYQNHRST